MFIITVSWGHLHWGTPQTGLLKPWFGWWDAAGGGTLLADTHLAHTKPSHHSQSQHHPSTHQTITPQPVPAPPSEINLPLASRHRLRHCPPPQTVYNLENLSSLIFYMRKSMKTPGFPTSFLCSQQGDKAVAPSWSPSVQLGVASSESSFSPLISQATL